jgi:threonine dehydrogenase-like Zn-dependent dehydrogenase
VSLFYTFPLLLSRLARVEADPRFLRLWTHVRLSEIELGSANIRTGGLPGGQSEYVRVPFGEVNCLKVPKGVAGMFP